MKTPLRQSPQTGFTLIELMVTIGLFMLAIGGVLANYNGFHTRQKVKQAALTFKEHLRFTQSEALAGKKPTDAGDPCVTKSLDGYRVTFTSSSDYVIGPVCETVASTDTKTYSFPDGITLSPTSSISFQSLNGKVNSADDVIYVISDGTTSYKITVSSSGDITDSGFVP